MEEINFIQEKIKEILDFMTVSTMVNVSELEKDIFKITIDGDNLNFLIGYRGESLDGLQAILGLMLFRRFGRLIVVDLDINGYKGKRIEKLEEIARTHIDKVRFFGKEVELPAMTAFERKHVHTFVQGYADIKSESVGLEPMRRVVLKPA
ncbi:MAG: R3H domain protein [candidate division WWE3 bacterium GW2011_GWA1_46_21]|uniref:R3H domain protein n=4 Tax=Katanobacteria TaxID=422282 RepID=A0A0G1PCP1_UNCKA|nr:MAG: R3H domain protein [candidate division WWE3 bacterium GW2011_GWA1_46_21]KKU48260.1 MAG: R3H domain protein [candidate division WWE3 bacterium GW2011_GWA2_46_9]KKU50023.1 MAG: hypothetical protein UX73_C0023G0003 [candidate division WWE3 bacterium GW2011_GWC1_47_10]KKU57106.1 MAG: R3H domain protein [candidate division WWE3 bacterium GW2011_GWB1_47_11]